MPSYVDRPFGAPPDTVVDLPPAPSVNKLRRIDFTAFKIAKRWCEAADKFVLRAKCRIHNPLRLASIERYELIIHIDEDKTKNDLDNGLKVIIDYLHRIEITRNDGQKNLRRLTAQWGNAPEGVRVTVRPMA